MSPRKARLKPGARAAVEDFLDSLDDLNEVQLMEIYAAWQARDREAHQHAWTSAVAAAATSGLTTEMHAARDAALAWAIKGTNAPWPYGFRMEDMWSQLKRQAAPALADAAAAIVLSGRLDQVAEAALLGPWRSISRPS